MLFYRPAGSYVMDRLELRLITSHPGVSVADIVVLIGSISVPAGLRVAEAVISSRKKVMLLQQSSWQNNVRMGDLVEQIRSPLSIVQTLSQMLSVHMRRSEISYDIVEDILVQADCMRDTLQQVQDVVYMTKLLHQENIMCYNNNALKNMSRSAGAQIESINSQLPNSLSTETSTSSSQESNRRLPVSLQSKDIEFPMPPLIIRKLDGPEKSLRCRRIWLWPYNLLQISSTVSWNCDLLRSSQVAVDEPALRQSLSNLIEGSLLRTEIGGKVEIVSTETPEGALIIIEDE